MRSWLVSEWRGVRRLVRLGCGADSGSTRRPALCRAMHAALADPCRRPGLSRVARREPEASRDTLALRRARAGQEAAMMGMPASDDEHRRSVAARIGRRSGRDWIDRLFRGLKSDLYGDTDFDGRMATAARRRRRAHAARGQPPPRDALGRRWRGASRTVGYLKIVAPWVGCAGVEQKGREAWVTPDQWSIYDTTDSYAVANPVRVEHLIVMVPKAPPGRARPRARPADGAPPRRQRRRRAAGARDHAHRLPRAARHVATPPRAASATRSRSSCTCRMLDLAGIGTAMTQREALRERIKQHVTRAPRRPGAVGGRASRTR